MSQKRLKQAVMEQVKADLKSPNFVTALVAQARKAQQPDAEIAEAEALRRKLKALETKIARLTNLLAETSTPEPLLRQLEVFERDCEEAAAALHIAISAAQTVRALSQITENQVRKLLADNEQNTEELDTAQLKDWLRGLIDKVELDPAHLSCRINYKIQLTGEDRLASPRGFEPRLPP